MEFIAGERDGVGIVEDNAELLFQLSAESLVWGLARLDFAARELPGERVRLSFRPLRDQYLATLAESACHYECRQAVPFSTSRGHWASGNSNCSSRARVCCVVFGVWTTD